MKNFFACICRHEILNSENVDNPSNVMELRFWSFYKDKHQQGLAARETGALEEAKDNVEKQVEALTWHLQLIALGMFKVLRVKCYY
ncbi:hypothetical protein C5167_021683 [Papaver somniferum]|uniref:Uncharacterized protein n=1 Tax=Papaver somniferum TaxID=3469 RepID=A0A4Y7JIU1_PAPSO|nr:hypothetical protein C5167_021683 [Papaver somniferum]